MLATTGQTRRLPAYQVAMGPVKMAASDKPMPCVMGDDPERMDSRVVVAARALRTQTPHPIHR